MSQVNPAEVLAEYQKNGYNIITPSITLEGLGKHYHAAIETVLISADPDQGDVYPHSKDNSKKKPPEKQWRIAKTGLDKLAVLAGIKWHIEGGTKRLDDGKDRNYVAYEAFGAIRKADGEMVPMKASYDLDLIVVRENLEVQYQEKGSKGNYSKEGQELIEYVKYCVDRDMRFNYAHRATKCESGARNRVIRSLLGIKKFYTGANLSKPFVVVKISYVPDHDDPEVKRLLTLASIGAQAQLYGMPAPPQLPPPTQQEYAESPDETIEAETIEDENGGGEPDDDDFENWDKTSKIKLLEGMANRKGYNLGTLFEKMNESISSLNDFSDIQLLKMKDRLEGMEDDEDIPL